MDAERYPKAARYLASLPAGEASHPECQLKGSVLRNMLDGTPMPFPREGLSPLARALVDSPPLASSWIPEVPFNALLLAHEDRVPRPVFEEWTYRRNRQLLASPLYRVLFLLLSPGQLFVGMARRWGAFRRGSTLEMLAHEHGLARVRLRYPPHLHDAHTLGNLAVAIRAACDAAGGRSSRVDVDGAGERETTFVVRWEAR